MSKLTRFAIETTRFIADSLLSKEHFICFSHSLKVSPISADKLVCLLHVISLHHHLGSSWSTVSISDVCSTLGSCVLNFFHHRLRQPLPMSLSAETYQAERSRPPCANARLRFDATERNEKGNFAFIFHETFATSYWFLYCGNFTVFDGSYFEVCLSFLVLSFFRSTFF